MDESCHLLTFVSGFTSTRYLSTLSDRVTDFLLRRMSGPHPSPDTFQITAAIASCLRKLSFDGQMVVPCLSQLESLESMEMLMADVLKLTDGSEGERRNKTQEPLQVSKCQSSTYDMFGYNTAKTEAIGGALQRCWGGGHDRRKAALNQILSILNKSAIFLTFPRCSELPPFAVKHVTNEHVTCNLLQAQTKPPNRQSECSI